MNCAPHSRMRAHVYGDYLVEGQCCRDDGQGLIVLIGFSSTDRHDHATVAYVEIQVRRDDGFPVVREFRRRP